MAEDIEIRNYNPETDYSQVKQILKEGGLFYEPTDVPERLAEKVRRDPDSIIVAATNDQVVGTVTIMEDGRMPFIFRLGVKEEFKRQGIGSRLMQDAEDRLRERGYNEVYIFVDVDKKELQGYYERQGYGKGTMYQWMYKELE